MMANRTETDQERLERLTNLMADGWCPCRSSDDDAAWMAERLAAAWEEVACLRREKSDLTRERDVARADWGAAVMGAEAESNRADRAEARALAAEQERDRRSDEAKYLADDVHQLEAERAALHTMIQTLEDRESQAPGLAARSSETPQEVAAERDRLRAALEEIAPTTNVDGTWDCEWCGGGSGVGHDDPCVGMIAEDALGGRPREHTEDCEAETDHPLDCATAATRLAKLTALAQAVRDEVECPSCGGCDDLSPCLHCAAERALEVPGGPVSEIT